MYVFDVGDVISNRFQVERVLSRGSVGQGFLCFDTVLSERVVCKAALQTNDLAHTEFREQYFKLRRVRSQGVAQALGYFAHDDRPVIALEFIDGVDLDKWMPGRPLSSRLMALTQIADALRDLHAEGITHGDLWGGVNVVAAQDRGCVLIDPQPELWGSSPSVASVERATDRESLADLIQRLAPEYAKNVLKGLAEALRSNVTTIDNAAGTLRTALRDAPIVLGSDATVAAAGEAYKNSVENLNRLYRRNRIARSEAIKMLAARIESLATSFDLEFKHVPAERGIEERHDEKGRGHFEAQYIQCVSPVGDHVDWTIAFEEIHDFYRPWPYTDKSIANGTWRVSGARSANGKIELRVYDDDTTQFFVAPATLPNQRGQYGAPEDPKPVPLNDEWLLERLSDLTGTGIIR